MSGHAGYRAASNPDLHHKATKSCSANFLIWSITCHFFRTGSIYANCTYHLTLKADSVFDFVEWISAGCTANNGQHQCRT
jgi:hypothetical protein